MLRLIEFNACLQEGWSVEGIGFHLAPWLICSFLFGFLNTLCHQTTLLALYVSSLIISRIVSISVVDLVG